MNNQCECRTKLSKLLRKLREKRKWWQNNTNDPHGVSSAVYTALAEVESAVRMALRDNRKD